MFRIDRRLVNISKEQYVLPANISPTPEKAENINKQKTEEKTGEKVNRVQKNNVKEKYDENKAAQNIISQARAEAQLLIKQGEQQKQQIIESASREGFTKGITEGRAIAEKEAAEIKKQLMLQQQENAQSINSIISQMEQSWAEIVDDLEEDFVTLSLAIAKKIINVTLEKDDTIFESMLQKALQRMKCEGSIDIRVSPNDFQRYFSSGSATFALGDTSITATVIEDSAVSDGGAFIESNGQTINAGIDSQLKHIELAFNQDSDEDDVQS